VETISAASFWQGYLVAADAGTSAQVSGHVAIEESVAYAEQERSVLEQQIESLTAQVDALITEVAHLRKNNDSATSDSVVPMDRGRRSLRSCCPERWIAELASGYEISSVDGNSFPVYQLERPDGEVVRFACHGVDDAFETPGSQLTSS